MKREELSALGITDEAMINKIMGINGADAEKSKQTITTLTAERDALQSQLTEANGKLTGYDPEWKTKSDQAQQEAAAKVAGLQYDYAAQAAASTLKFSSKSAERAFLADLKEKKLPLQEDKLLGFDDFVGKYKEADPDSFVPDGGTPKFVSQTPGAAAAETGKEQANAAIRAAFGNGKE